MGYKVIGRNRLTRWTEKPHHHDLEARILMREFDLFNDFTIEEVIARWEDYSDSMCAGWMNPDKESVERVFGVVLEETEEE